jgi:hypothetical protein
MTLLPSAPQEIRTLTVRVLSALPLPVGLQELVEPFHHGGVLLRPFGYVLMRLEGLEPPRFTRQILSLVRLPIPP